MGTSMANSEDSDEMPHNVAFHQSLHCFPRYKAKMKYMCGSCLIQTNIREDR